MFLGQSSAAATARGLVSLAVVARHFFCLLIRTWYGTWSWKLLILYTH